MLAAQANFRLRELGLLRREYIDFNNGYNKQQNNKQQQHIDDITTTNGLFKIYLRYVIYMYIFVLGLIKIDIVIDK